MLQPKLDWQSVQCNKKYTSEHTNMAGCTALGERRMEVQADGNGGGGVGRETKQNTAGYHHSLGLGKKLPDSN